MKNRDLIEFAKYFSAGVEKGVGYYTKGQQQQAANAIATERNRIMAADKAARDARENKRLDIYGRSVDNQGVLAQARAKAALAKIGAGKPSGDDAALYEKYSNMGLTVAPGTGGGNVTNNYNTTNDGSNDTAPINPPASEPEPPAEPGAARGGMIRKYDDGGLVTPSQQLSSMTDRIYSTAEDTTSTATSKAVKNAGASSGGGGSFDFGGGADGATSSGQSDGGSGDGGDAAKGGLIIKRFADGGISGDMSLSQAEQGGPGSRPGSSGLSRASNMFGSSFKLAPGSLNPNLKTPPASNVRPVGPAGSGPGGSYTTADTQPGGALDLGGGLSGVTYRRGGAVRRYANGGAVIDTGTSGPGSGFGVPAAPPAGVRRANA